MTENDLRKYWEIYKIYWDLFRKYAAKFEESDAYWQELIHAADYIHQEYKSVNEALSYSMALATVKAVEYEYKRNISSHEEGIKTDSHDQMKG